MKPQWLYGSPRWIGILFLILSIVMMIWQVNIQTNKYVLSFELLIYLLLAFQAGTIFEQDRIHKSLDYLIKIKRRLESIIVEEKLREMGIN